MARCVECQDLLDKRVALMNRESSNRNHDITNQVDTIRKKMKHLYMRTSFSSFESQNLNYHSSLRAIRQCNRKNQLST